MLDPIVLTLISVSFGLMFLLASAHKFRALDEFRAVLDDYRVVPAMIVPVVAVSLPLFEAGLGLAWLILKIELWLPTTVLLVLYTASISINLLRGRVHISCGCGFGASTKTDEALSWGLVIRNVILISAALITSMPVASRAVGVLDYVTLVAALIAIFLLFAAGNQLIRNMAAINTWRRPVAHHD
jgi:hypothetical protein